MTHADGTLIIENKKKTRRFVYEYQEICTEIFIAVLSVMGERV